MRRIAFAVAVILSLASPIVANAQDATVDVSVEIWRFRTDGDTGNLGPCTVAMYPLLPSGQVESVSIGTPIGTGYENARQPGVIIRDEVGAIVALWDVADATLVYSGSAGVRCVASHTFTLPTSHPYYTMWLDSELIHVFASDAPPADLISIQLQKGTSEPS